MKASRKSKKPARHNAKKTVLFFGFIIIGFSILCALGTWQVIRLEEKQNLIAQIEEGFKAEPVAFSSLEENNDFSYKRVSLEGRFIPHSEFFLLNKKQGDEWGKEIIGLLETNNKFVIVNLDWLAKDEDAVLPNTHQHYVGYFMPFHRPHLFRAEHTGKSRTLLWLEKEFLEKETDKQLFDWVFYVTENKNPDYKTHHSLQISLPNNHRHYAFFWYTIAGILLVMGVYVWRSRGKQ